MRSTYKENKWKENFEYAESMKGRYQNLLNMLDEIQKLAPQWGGVESVLDLGCGIQYLRELISENVKYVGVDLYPHKPDTIICDFNKKQFIDCEDKFDAVFLAGVLEYIYDIKWLLKKISRISCKFFCCTYNFEDYAFKKADIWVNLMSVNRFLDIANKNGFRLVKFDTFSEGQMTYMIFVKKEWGTEAFKL